MDVTILVTSTNTNKNLCFRIFFSRKNSYKCF